jgi:hypothetical protein
MPSLLLPRLLVTCVCALALTAPAQAQDPQVDPDSPTGTEYQLPIDRAREQAGGGSGASRGGSQGTGPPGEPPPLFGAGVEEKRQPTGRRTKPGSDSSPARTADVEPELGSSTPARVRAQAPAPDSGGSGLVAIGGGAAGVLLLGGLVGLAWRRRARAS